MKKLKILRVGENKNEKCQIESDNIFDFSILQVLSSSDAKQLLKQQKFDAVIINSDLPDEKGLQLTKSIYNNYPEIIRFLILNENQHDLIIQTVGLVHQYFIDPVESNYVYKSLNNSLKLKSKLHSNIVRDRINSIKSLPSPPKIYNQIISELQSDEPSILNISQIINKDIAITTKLLQLVNSAFFGLKIRIENLQQVISYLGLDTVKSIVFSTGLFNQFNSPQIGNISIESIYNQSVNTGAKSRLIAHTFGLNKRVTDNALLAGLLHNIGNLLMLAEFRDELKKSIVLAKEKSIKSNDAIEEIIGANASTLGAYLLSLWGLPDSIVESVALHDCPAECPHPTLNTLTAVHLGYALESDEKNNVINDKNSLIDSDYINQLGIKNQIPSLRGFTAGAVF
ncbi:MAG: response regulator [candidate division Zixibacteria bacterium]|nr:response regulator [candidate division Zixibacteria bacterium]